MLSEACLPACQLDFTECGKRLDLIMLVCCVAEPEAAATEAVVPEPLPEPYTSLLKQAKESPTEFNTWTSLISAAEKLVCMNATAKLILWLLSVPAHTS